MAAQTAGPTEAPEGASEVEKMKILRGRASWLGAALAAAIGFNGCTSCQGGGDGDALPPDVCNALDQALNDPQCAIAIDTDHLDFISLPNDQDWFSIRTPATLDARSLL